MAKFKVRRVLLAQGGIEIGAQGNTLSEFLFGTVDIICPSATASDTGVRTASITNLDGDAQIFLTPGSLPQGFVLVAACVNAAGGEFSASFMNATTANIATSALCTVQYLAVAS